MANHSTIPTRFLVISDTHNFDIEAPSTDAQLKLPTPQADVLLHCGDLTQVGGVTSFKGALKMLGKIDAELKLVIAGNHDLELDKAYWTLQRDDDGLPEDPEDHDLALEAMTGPLANEAGVIFLSEGTHSFVLNNGAKFTIYVSPYTPAFGDWAFAYKHNEDRFNGPNHAAHNVTSIATNPIPENVDIIMTHGPPKGILDWCPNENVGCENILQAVQRVKPILHCFGHIHESNGAKIIHWEEPAANKAYLEEDLKENPYPRPLLWDEGQGERTLAVNATIMTSNYQFENAPWLINIHLPCT